MRDSFFWSFICQIYVTSLDVSINTQVKNIIDTRSFTHTLGIEQVLREGIEVDRVNEDIEVRYCLSKIWLKHCDSLRLYLRQLSSLFRISFNHYGAF